MWAIVRDITERKRIDVVLREDATRAKQYLDIAGVILLVIDEVSRIINRKGQQVLGYSAGICSAARRAISKLVEGLPFHQE